MILITVDALRADHLGVYGYLRPTSPAIDAFAREAIVVRDHIAQAPYTKASIASLFSGLFPTSHKAFTTSRTFAEAMSNDGMPRQMPYTDVLDERITTLAERLAAYGYHTIGLTANPFLIRDFGFAQGFQRYEFLTSPGGDLASASRVVETALDSLDRRPPGQPVFLWIHLMEPHSPYAPPPSLAELFPIGSPPRPIALEAIPPWIRIGDRTDLNLYVSRYDAEIRSADDALGVFFGALKTRGLWDSSVIALTADHGEEFMDHGGMEHNLTLYDELVRVPFILKVPGLGFGMIEEQTQAVDVAPTIVSLVGGTVAAHEMHGMNLRPILDRRGSREPYAYAEIVGRRFALRTRSWKLISSLQGGKQLFDLRADPQERENVASVHPDLVRSLESVLARIVAEAIKAGDRIQGQYAPIPDAVLERLRSLGYVQ